MINKMNRKFEKVEEEFNLYLKRCKDRGLERKGINRLYIRKKDEHMYNLLKLLPMPLSEAQLLRRKWGSFLRREYSDYTILSYINRKYITAKDGNLYRTEMGRNLVSLVKDRDKMQEHIQKTIFSLKVKDIYKLLKEEKLISQFSTGSCFNFASFWIDGLPYLEIFIDLNIGKVKLRYQPCKNEQLVARNLGTLKKLPDRIREELVLFKLKGGR